MAVVRKPSAAASSASSGVFADFPNFAPQMIELDGAQETNAAIQEWWNTAKYQLLQQNDIQQQTSLKIQATSQASTGTLQAQIDIERTVRADADEALATDISTVSATLTTSIGIVAAAVVTEATARATADGFLSANYSITVTAGSVVTGMQLNSSLGGGASSSTIDFQGSNFRIWDGTSAYPIFATAPGVVTLASTLVVNTSGKVFIGTGTYGNTNTAWYVDSSGQFSLKDKLTWDGSLLTIQGSISATTGTIGGWTINSTTISANNAVLNSSGNLLLGTSNDIVILSATDGTYRLWAGNTSAAGANFSVTKTGALFATGGTFSGTLTSVSGTIGGFTLSSTALTSGSGVQTLNIYSNGNGISLGNASGARAIIYADVGNSLDGFAVYNSSNIKVGDFFLDTGVGNAGSVYLYNSVGTLKIALTGGDGTIAGTLFSGSGASLTSLNPSNISSGVLRMADGSTGAPSFSFSSDIDTGWRWNSSGDMRAVTNGADRFVIRDAVIVCLVPLKLDNAYVATPQVPTGYITFQDNTGTTYKVSCNT